MAQGDGHRSGMFVRDSDGSRRVTAEMRHGLVELGLRIRAARKKAGVTLDALAARAGLSKGLLSRIENFRAVPSLPALSSLARGLELDMGDLLRGIGAPAAGAYLLMRAGQGRVVAREKAAGFRYTALCDRLLAGSHMQVFILDLAPAARRRLLTSHGEELIFILKGDIVFTLGDKTVAMSEGDALFFNGLTPHAPANPGGRGARLLALYFLG